MEGCRGRGARDDRLEGARHGDVPGVREDVREELPQPEILRPGVQGRAGQEGREAQARRREGRVAMKRCIASVSWGKDSLAMLHGLIERGMPLDEVVFYDTGMEFDAIYAERDRSPLCAEIRRTRAAPSRWRGSRAPGRDARSAGRRRGDGEGHKPSPFLCKIKKERKS